jgi:hypothetical protein
MITNPPIELAQIGVRLLDDAYLAWLSAEAECQRMLEAWSGATSGGGGTAYVAYRAALDREEAAARDLQRVSEATEPCRDSLARLQVRVG